MKDSLTVKYMPSPSPKIRIETPVGAIESDSGSHIVDVFTVAMLFIVLYACYKMINKFFKRK